MIDHITLYVSNYTISKQFYTKTLAPLGYTPQTEFEMNNEQYCGFADKSGKHDYWIVSGNPSTRTHIALTAPSHSAIKEFYEAALANGGLDNGTPGPRPEYGEQYYAAFVFDPDGNNIEAMMR